MIQFVIVIAVLVPNTPPGIAPPRAHYRELPIGTWVLRQLADEPVAPADPEAATLALFTDHTVAGTAYCNQMGTKEVRWLADPSGRKGVFRHDTRETTLWTLAMCGGYAPGQVGNRFWQRMRLSRTWSMTAATMTIAFSDGSRARLVRTIGQ